MPSFHLAKPALQPPLIYDTIAYLTKYLKTPVFKVNVTWKIIGWLCAKLFPVF